MTYLLDFTGKNNFLILFARVIIKTHFPLERQVTYFPKVIVQMIHLLISLTIENREASSAKNLVFVDRYTVCACGKEIFSLKEGKEVFKDCKFLLIALNSILFSFFHETILPS